MIKEVVYEEALLDSLIKETKGFVRINKRKLYENNKNEGSKRAPFHSSEVVYGVAVLLTWGKR